MKNLIILLSLLSTFSCKKTQENSKNQTVSKEIILNNNWKGDVMISDLNFVNSINPSCKLSTPFLIG